MSKICNGCGAVLADNQSFCTVCGTAVQMTSEPVHHVPPKQADSQSYEAGKVPKKKRKSNKGNGPTDGRDELITTGGYIGIMLLMCIPVVGIVLMIIWAFGGCKKINKRNFARASLIMMAIGLVVSLILGAVVKRTVRTVAKKTGIESSQDIASKKNDEHSEEVSDGLLSSLAALAALGESLDSNSDDKVTNSDIEELEALGDVLQSLENLTGQVEEEGKSSGNIEGGSLSDLIENVEEINRDAEAANDGWPRSLRAYPGGTANAVASYRTEITGTSQEEMMEYIEDLKKDGFEFQDFYEFGFSEEEMLNSMNAWWATDGKIYLSISYYDGTVTVDHMYELPDLASYFE